MSNYNKINSLCTFLAKTYLNEQELDQYIIQICPQLNKYVIWDKNTREHLVNSKDELLIFYSCKDAEYFLQNKDAYLEIKGGEIWER